MNLLVLSALWDDKGKAVRAQMNVQQGRLETQAGNLPVPSSPLLLPKGLWTPSYMYHGMDKVLQSIFENHIVSCGLALWNDVHFTLSLLPARPVSRSWKAIKEVSCLLFKSM